MNKKHNTAVVFPPFLFFSLTHPPSLLLHPCIKYIKPSEATDLRPGDRPSTKVASSFRPLKSNLLSKTPSILYSTINLNSHFSETLTCVKATKCLGAYIYELFKHVILF